MNRVRGGELALLLWAAGASVGCKGKCWGSVSAQCEGDVRVSCPGGWLNKFAWTPERENCRALSKRCVALSSGWVGCEVALGTCDAATFKSHCSPHEPGDPTGRMVTCRDGEQLPAGEQCDVPLGACDSSTFRPYCYPHHTGWATGSTVQCRNGEKFALGNECNVRLGTCDARTFKSHCHRDPGDPHGVTVVCDGNGVQFATGPSCDVPAAEPPGPPAAGTPPGGSAQP